MDVPKTEKGLPKIIWILWLQGFENSPKLVKKCARTWEKANKDWKVIKVNRKSLRKYIEINGAIKKNEKNMEKSDISDIVRMKLLSRYGGIWVDSTCICQRPLNTWLQEYMDSGFFAFSEPTTDREVASWFLASRKNNYLIKSWCSKYIRYFTNNKFYNQNTRIGNFIKMKIEGMLNFNKKTSKIWFSRIVKNSLKIYPYFVLHYKFFENIEEDQKARSVWNRTPKYDAKGPLIPIRHGLLSPPSPEIKEEVLERRVPMYKLNWGIDIENVEKESLVDYILTQNPYVKSE